SGHVGRADGTARHRLGPPSARGHHVGPAARTGPGSNLAGGDAATVGDPTVVLTAALRDLSIVQAAVHDGAQVSCLPVPGDALIRGGPHLQDRTVLDG